MNQRGQTLGEVTCVVAIVGICAAVSLPAFLSMTRRNAVRMVSDQLRGIFRGVRARAIARGRNVGVKFTRDGADWQYATYEDGDGDGIRSDDIKKNVDRLVAGPLRLAQQQQLAAIALPPVTIVDPDGDKLQPTAEPVQFNNSMICSFSPLGAGTPGSIYLTDGAGGVWCLRVYGPTGRVRLLRYEAQRRKWVGQ